MAIKGIRKVLGISAMLLLLLGVGLLAAFLLYTGEHSNGQAAGDASLPLSQIRLPPGFKIDIYAVNVPNAREMTTGSNGTIYVGTMHEGKVYAIKDIDGDGKADRVYTIARGLHMPNGVAYRNGSLYVAEVSRIIRLDDIDARLDSPPEPVVVYDKYPNDEWHGWKFIRFGPDGMLYVPVGAPCNVCGPAEPFASITRLNPDGTGYEVYARGIRNTVGFDWDDAGRLWFTDNGRDYLGNDAPPDELNCAPVAGLNFGFPHVHGKAILDPEYGKGYNTSQFTLPEVELDAHVAVLGMKFYRGDMFPAEYHGQIFIAEHGSWNRDTPIGYRIELVTVKDGKAVNRTVFADGWLQGGKAWGRPVDVLVLPDGSMLVSDDTAGVIYRITYSG
jgi:glucose/arabinose dehydrogenase